MPFQCKRLDLLLFEKLGWHKMLQNETLKQQCLSGYFIRAEYTLTLQLKIGLVRKVEKCTEHT